MRPSPKDRFLANAKLAKVHANTVADTNFLLAVDMAMLQYQEIVFRDMPDPAAAAQKLKGATEFVALLLNLANPPAGKRPRDIDNLQPE